MLQSLPQVSQGTNISGIINDLETYSDFTAITEGFLAGNTPGIFQNWFLMKLFDSPAIFLEVFYPEIHQKSSRINFWWIYTIFQRLLKVFSPEILQESSIINYSYQWWLSSQGYRCTSCLVSVHKQCIMYSGCCTPVSAPPPTPPPPPFDRSLCPKDWFVGEMDRSAAEVMLKCRKDGTYLLRVRPYAQNHLKHETNYVLSMKWVISRFYPSFYSVWFNVTSGWTELFVTQECSNARGKVFRLIASAGHVLSKLSSNLLNTTRKIH